NLNLWTNKILIHFLSLCDLARCEKERRERERDFTFSTYFYGQQFLVFVMMRRKRMRRFIEISSIWHHLAKPLSHSVASLVCSHLPPNLVSCLFVANFF